MCPFNISQNELARFIGVSPRRINAIVLGQRAISPDTALGLAEAFGIPADFWMALQADYDLEIARVKAASRPPRSRRPFAHMEDWSSWLETPSGQVLTAEEWDRATRDNGPRHGTLAARLDLIEAYVAIRPYGTPRHGG